MFHIPKVHFDLVGWIDHPDWVQEVYLIPGCDVPVYQVRMELHPTKPIVPLQSAALDYLKFDIYRDSFMERTLEVRTFDDPSDDGM